MVGAQAESFVNFNKDKRKINHSLVVELTK